MDKIKYFLALLIVTATYYEVKARRYQSYNLSSEEETHPWEQFQEIATHNIKEGEAFFKQEIKKYRDLWKGMISEQGSGEQNGTRHVHGNSTGSESSEGYDASSGEDKSLVPDKAFKKFVLSLQCENSHAYRKLLKRYKASHVNSGHAVHNRWLKHLVHEENKRPDNQTCTRVSCTLSTEDPVIQPTSDVDSTTKRYPENTESLTTTDRRKVVGEEPSKPSNDPPTTSTEPSEVLKTNPEPLKSTEPSEVLKTNPEPLTSTEPSEVLKTNPEPLTSTEPSDVLETNSETLTSTKPSDVTQNAEGESVTPKPAEAPP